MLIAPISLPLQQIRYALRIKINQSLYRGTAFATPALFRPVWEFTVFQSLYRGTAFATYSDTSQYPKLACFNPSIEGQPLQLKGNDLPLSTLCVFQSLYRGTAFATSDLALHDGLIVKFQSLYRGTAFATILCLICQKQGLDRFNPSIEGQPLQPSDGITLHIGG